MNKLFLLPALLASMLCSCYTNYNQRFLDGYREFSGYDLNYDPRAEEVERLEPELYRCGQEWYIAGIPCKVVAQYRVPSIHSAFSSWYDRNEPAPVLTKRAAVRYHRITPAMAALLRRDQKPSPKMHLISDGELAADLQRAGGSWIPRLPAGARRVPAAWLASRLTAPHWVQVDSAATHAPWYIHTASGLTLVCVDAPYSVACTTVYAAGCIVAAPVILWLYVANR